MGSQANQIQSGVKSDKSRGICLCLEKKNEKNEGSFGRNEKKLTFMKKLEGERQ